MNIHDEMKRPWFREPMVWLIAGLPLAAVVASLTTVWIAARNADTLVKEGYQKEGFAVQGTLEVDRAAARLGVRATLSVEGEAVTARLSGSFDKPPERLTLTLAHPTEIAMDVETQLQAAGDGVYRANLPPIPAGKRLIILESKEQAWRLRAPWEAPFGGRLDLAGHEADS